MLVLNTSIVFEDNIAAVVDVFEVIDVQYCSVLIDCIRKYFREGLILGSASHCS